jgi:signal transduction histidine kinase
MHSAINLRCYKDANFSHLTFNPKASRDLSLIMKEAFTNIYKHAEAKNITVELNECKGAKACFSIKEDGVGFNQDEVLKKNGLKNMAQRASRSGFILDITSKVGEGSTILITIK